jgi:nucleotide-binding universal stress UspA family protein
MRVLCATDLSSRSDRALRRAGLLAREAGAELILLSVVDDDQPESLVSSERREVAALLAEQASSMQAADGPRPQLRVEAGDAFDVILRAAEAEAADLIVMGEHRKRLLRDMFIGTTIERVMRRGHRPVLMVNRPAERPYHRVLAAVDMSDSSAEALRAAARLGFLAGSELTVFHAVQLPGKGNLVLADLPTDVIEGKVAAAVAESRREVARFLRGVDSRFASAPPPILAEEGAPAEALRRCVERSAPDLVVLGTGRRGGLARLVLGSVAEEVLRTLDCDVLAVPPPAA